MRFSIFIQFVLFLNRIIHVICDRLLMISFRLKVGLNEALSISAFYSFVLLKHAVLFMKYSILKNNGKQSILNLCFLIKCWKINYHQKKKLSCASNWMDRFWNPLNLSDSGHTGKKIAQALSGPRFYILFWTRSGSNRNFKFSFGPGGA